MLGVGGVGGLGMSGVDMSALVGMSGVPGMSAAPAVHRRLHKLPPLEWGRTFNLSCRHCNSSAKPRSCLRFFSPSTQNVVTITTATIRR
jgi:hypothetical protein